MWTIVSHDLQMQTTVVGYSPEKYSVTQLIYSASMDQISAITSSAEYCEQYVSYFCRMSRLLNTPGRLRWNITFNYSLSWCLQLPKQSNRCGLLSSRPVPLQCADGCKKVQCNHWDCFLDSEAQNTWFLKGNSIIFSLWIFFSFMHIYKVCC